MLRLTSRALTKYDYNQIGQLDKVANYWQTLANPQNGSGPIYGSSYILDSRYTYDKGQNSTHTMLRNKMEVFANVGGNEVLQTEEEYSYDTIDQLTQYKFRNSAGGAWTTANYAYDSAGNRTTGGAVYDNLNRMTTAPGGGTRTYDLLGNTLTRNGENYAWDAFGRLSGISNSQTTDSRSYWYRPDGLRILRLVDSTTAAFADDFSAWTEQIESQSIASPTYRYFYDGQMVHEDDYARVWTINDSPHNFHDINRYGLGARGMDWFERESKRGANGTTRTTTFPVYDGHGNNLASLTRNGSGGYALSNLRFYDAWGAPRGGGHDSDTRYCASIGHRTDDESGLIYMRARYYEPSSGRFASEDPALHGINWYAYCGNDPIGRFDSSGKQHEDAASSLWKKTETVFLFVEIGFLIAGWISSPMARPMILSGLTMMAFFFNIENLARITDGTHLSLGEQFIVGGALVTFGAANGALLGMAASAGPIGAKDAWGLFASYSGLLMLFMTLCAIEQGVGP